MVEAEISQQAHQLVCFVQKMQFKPIAQHTSYHHMGATITDCVLQAGLNYRHVVYPRVRNLIAEFPSYSTTCDFIILMQTISLRELIRWNNERKLQLIEQISWLLFNCQVETEPELAKWLMDDNNVQCLLELSGVGPKTIDYLKTLSGNPSIAIDRHLWHFLELANIGVNSYQEASAIYHQAAKLLCISEYELDKNVWQYMSRKASKL